jgi:cytochrome c553
LPRWQPYLERIRTAGHHLERAGDVVAAAQATAVLGRECARCHEESGAKVALPVQSRPDDDARLAPQMLAHQWAAARMWEGLIGPAGDRWLDGAQALTEVPLTIVAEEPKIGDLADTIGGTGGSIGDDVARVRLYANRAVTTSSQDARAEIFGQLLATCAHCHIMVRDR